MKGDMECEVHNCEYLKFCNWHPSECYGKPWKKTQLKKVDVVEEMDKLERRESLGEAKS